MAFYCAADKALTIGKMAVWRDYVDIFILLKGEFLSIKEMISLANKKFKGEFNEALFLQQLIYFGDLKEGPIEFIGENYSASEIRSFLEKKVRDFSRGLTKER